MYALLLLACTSRTAHPADSPNPDDSADTTDSADSTDTTDSGTPGTTWTILVYMDGDNSLESYVMHDLNELENGGDGGGVRVLVQADRIPGYDDKGGNWTDTRRYEIRGAPEPGVQTEMLESLGELDMGDPSTLSDFLAWGRSYAPADHYALFLWDHGDSWTMRAGMVASDDTSGTWLSIADGDLHAGLADHVAAAGPLDLIGFDACYMASWEVADTLRDQAKLLLASEAWVGGEGILYEPFLKALRTDPGQDPAALAAAAASLSVSEGGERTFSAVDLTQIPAITEAIDALALQALESPEATAALDAARLGSEGADPDYPLWYHDLGSLADAAGDTALQEALEAAVVGKFGNDQYPYASGLTIFAEARSKALVQYREGAGATWAQNTHWDEFLEAVIPAKP